MGDMFHEHHRPAATIQLRSLNNHPTHVSGCKREQDWRKSKISGHTSQGEQRHSHDTQVRLIGSQQPCIVFGALAVSAQGHALDHSKTDNKDAFVHGRGDLSRALNVKARIGRRWEGGKICDLAHDLAWLLKSGLCEVVLAVGCVCCR